MGYHSLPDKILKVNKPHSCWGCCSKIEKGQFALKQAGVWENEGFWNGWFCERCASFLKTKSSFDWDDYREGLEQGSFTQHDDFLTHEITPLNQINLNNYAKDTKDSILEIVNNNSIDDGLPF